MAIISGVTVAWTLSPRIITIPSPLTSATVEDLQDTLLDLEDSVEGMIWPHLRNFSGGENLGGGVTVGFTMELQNAQLAFEARTTQLEEGTETSGSADGVTLTDTAATFETNNVARGDLVFNATDLSQASVVEVVSETQLLVDGLAGGVDNLFQSGDSYVVYDVVACQVSGGNLVAVDDVAAELAPIFPTFGTQVTRAASSSATLASQEDAQFGGAVWVDALDGSPGTTFPIGTEKFPTDNVADAITIAAGRNIKRYQVRSTMTFASDPPQSEWDGFGGGAGILLAPGADLAAVAIQDVEIVGAISGSFGMTAVDLPTQISRSGFSNNTFTNLHGFLIECLFDDTTFTPLLAPLVIVDCASKTSGTDPGLTIDATAGAVDVSIRRYSGGVQINNLTDAGAMVTCEISAGNIVIDSSCTAGTIVCRGVGSITDNSAGSTVVDQIVDAAKVIDIHGGVERKIWVDTTLGSDGDGYQGNPHNSFTSAIDNAEANGINIIVLLADATADRQLKNFTFEGIGSPVLTLNSQDFKGSVFRSMKLEGTMVSTGPVHTIDCVLRNNLTGVYGRFDRCGLAGDITLNTASDSDFVDCYSTISGLSRPSINVNGGACDVSVRDYRGGLTMKGMTNAAGTASVGMAQGRLNLDATNTAGLISVRGTADFTDSSAGTTVDTTGLLDPGRLLDIYTRLGLNLNDPITDTTAGITSQSGDIDVVRTGDGETTSTLTRQP